MGKGKTNMVFPRKNMFDWLKNTRLITGQAADDEAG